MAHAHCILAALVLLSITCVYGHVAMTTPTPVTPGFNAAGYCGNSPTNLPPYGQNTAGANIINYVVGGTNFTFAYALAHNFGSLQSAYLITSSDYSDFGASSTKIIDGVPYTEGIQNYLTLTLPLDEIPVAAISIIADQLQYGECSDFNIRCPIGTQGSNCASYNYTALQYLAGLEKSNYTAFEDAIAELNDPNLAQIKSNVLAQINDINNPSSGAGVAIGVSIFVIALVGIIAGTLYYRHRDPEGFASKVSATKYHMGNGWDYVKSKFSGSSGSSLPVTRTTTTPVATTTTVAVQPTIARPTPPSKPVPGGANRPTPPPKKTADNINSPIPPPKQGGTRAPLPPSEEIQNPGEYKYAPPAKELPSKPATPAKELPSKPTPPPKRTNN